MPNLTRNPFLVAQSGALYTTNMGSMIITVDGQPVNSKWVVNAFVTNLGPEGPYVESFILDESGRIIEEGGQPVTKKLYGKVEVQGNPSTCGCWRGRKTHNWWARIQNGTPGY